MESYFLRMPHHLIRMNLVNETGTPVQSFVSQFLRPLGGTHLSLFSHATSLPPLSLPTPPSLPPCSSWLRPIPRRPSTALRPPHAWPRRPRRGGVGRARPLPPPPLRAAPCSSSPRLRPRAPAPARARRAAALLLLSGQRPSSLPPASHPSLRGHRDPRQMRGGGGGLCRAGGAGDGARARRRR